MSKPLIATISHELGRRAAKQRIAAGLDEIHARLSPFATSVEEHWTDDRLDFQLVALGRAISGRMDVFDDYLRIEVSLPGMLGFLGATIAGRIREHGLKLLGGR